MSQIKKHDFIEIEYTGSVKEEGFIFDTSDENVAKENGVYTPRTEYGPIIVCVGENQLLPGLDKKVEGLELGEYEFDLTAEEGFGKNDPRLIQLIPESKFKKDDVKPVPGLRVQVDNAVGTIVRAGGGRVVVNFNHPLAGKDLHYKINIKRIVTDDIEKIKSIFKVEYGIAVPEIKKEGDTIKIDLKTDVPEELKKAVIDRLKSLIGEKNIEFVKPQAQPDKASEQ